MILAGSLFKLLQVFIATNESMDNKVMTNILDRCPHIKATLHSYQNSQT